MATLRRSRGRRCRPRRPAALVGLGAMVAVLAGCAGSPLGPAVATLPSRAHASAVTAHPAAIVAAAPTATDTPPPPRAIALAADATAPDLHGLTYARAEERAVAIGAYLRAYVPGGGDPQDPQCVADAQMPYAGQPVTAPGEIRLLMSCG